MKKSKPVNSSIYCVFLAVVVFWFIGWCIKITFFKPYLYNDIKEFPIINMFFPVFFRHYLTAQLAYAVPFVTLMLILIRKKVVLVVNSIIYVGCAFILSCHNDTYNDATFVTSFWVGLWLLWLAVNIDNEDKNFLTAACVLAQGIVGMIFFGGFIGKLTPGYFNGDVIANIFVIERGYWPFSIIRELSTGDQRLFAQCLSWVILVGEGVGALGALLPFRLYAAVIPFFLLGFIVINTWMILSVITCLIGLLWVCLIWSMNEGHRNRA